MSPQRNEIMPALQAPTDELDLKAIARTTGVICKRFGQLTKPDQKYVLQKLLAIVEKQGAPCCDTGCCATEK